MLEIGRINRLKIASRVGGEIYLSSPGAGKILLTGKKPGAQLQAGEFLDVFVYADQEGHLAATTTVPKAMPDEIAYLKTVSVNRTGAFMDWGLPKDLLVPASEQKRKMEAGKSYLVKLYLDEQNRILGTTRIDRHLAEEGHYFKPGQKVSLLIAGKSDLGVKAIVNNTHWGMLYENEIFQPLATGETVTGFIKQIRDDYRIDLSLYQPGYRKVNDLAETLLTRLKENHGALPLSDNSPPEAIYAAFGVSKKAFKQALGALYKKKLVLIEKDSVKLM